MNSKQAKKLRWYARAQEAMMPAPAIDKNGVSSLLLVYPHRKVVKDPEGNEHEYFVHTIQYNPRTSGKGFYRVLKKRGASIKQGTAECRLLCQTRVAELLSAKAAHAAKSGQDGAAPVPDRAEPRAGNVV